MPQLIPFTEDEVMEMRRMRWAGASLREIGTYFDTSASTIFSYVRGVQPQRDGQQLEYVPLNQVNNWRSVLPDEGLLLPQWFITWMETRLKIITQPHFEGSPATDLENEDDERHGLR
jgi:hypothetical protein